MQTDGFGVFAGRNFAKDDLLMWNWRTLVLPKTWPGNSVLWYYFFGHNETHISLPLGYGSVANNHESPNIQYASAETDATKTGFVVRGGFQCGNRNVLNIRMDACIFRYLRTYIHAYAYVTCHTYVQYHAYTHTHVRAQHTYAHTNFQGHQRYRGRPRASCFLWRRFTVHRC